MTTNPFEERLKELVAGNKSELVVERDDFMQFREAWVAFPQRKEIVGEAGLNGRITYRYVKSTENVTDNEEKY